MRIVAITMVKNEIDIIEAMVRHTASIADQVVVLDHASVDGTPDVLNSLQKEGLPLEILHDRNPAKRQGEQMTRLMHEHALAVHAADWILPLDADEFVQPNRQGLISDANESDRPVGLLMRTYVPQRESDANERNPVIRITGRRRAEVRNWFKVFVPASLARRPGARLTEGNHELAVGDAVLESRIARTASIAHLPIRSPGQYIAKIAIGHLSRQVIPERRSDWGYHYRQPFEQLKSDPALLAANYVTNGDNDADYMLDPIAYLGGPLRYTPETADHWRPAQTIAAFAEHIAGQYAAVAAGLPLEDRQFVARFATTLSRLYAQFNLKDESLLARQAEIERLCLEIQRREVDIRSLEELMRREVSARDDAIAELRTSWTWRVGMLLTAPGRLLKRAFQSRRDDR